MIELLQHCRACRRPWLVFTSTGLPDAVCPFCGGVAHVDEVRR